VLETYPNTVKEFVKYLLLIDRRGIRINRKRNVSEIWLGAKGEKAE
jgi:hypothetical protein